MRARSLTVAAMLALMGCTHVPTQGESQNSPALQLLDVAAAASPACSTAPGPVGGLGAPARAATPAPANVVRDSQGRIVVLQPTITAAQAEAVASQEVGGIYSTIDAELKTYQWIADNAESSQSAYSPDSVCWLVTIKGELNMNPSSRYYNYIEAKVPVSADIGAPGGLQMCGGNCDAVPVKSQANFTPPPPPPMPAPGN